MKEQDLLEEIGKVSEELIAAHALPDAKRYGEGGAEHSVTAKEQIVMSEKKNEYIKNPFIRALPAIAAAAAVLVAGVIILPKTGIMRTPATRPATSVETSEVTETSDYRLNNEGAHLLVNPELELEHSASMDIFAELEYAGQGTSQTVWYGGFMLEKNGKLLYKYLPASVQPENSAQQAGESVEGGAVYYDKEPDPIPVICSAQGAVPFGASAHELDAHWIQNEPGDLMMTVFCRVGSPAANPILITVPVTDYSVKDIGGVELPDVNNWTYNEAKRLIQEAGLFVDKRSAYSDEIPEGHVISTDPEGRSVVSPGTYVRVFVSLGPNRNTVLIPNFIGMDWELAKTMADGMGLILGKNPVPSSEPEGTVLRQDRKVGEEVAEDTVVELEVSAGSADGEVQARSVRIKFQIPAAAADGLFHIDLYKDGAVWMSGSNFNPEYAAGVTSLEVTVEEDTDVIAYLVNNATDAKAEIGTYHIDYNNRTSTPVQEVNMEEVFRQVTKAAE